MRLTIFRNTFAVVWLSLFIQSVSAQPVIDAVTSIDAAGPNDDAAVGAIAQNGWGIAYGPDIGYGNEPPTKVILNGEQTLSQALSSGWILFHVPPDTPLGDANVAVEIDGLTSAPFGFTLSAYAPTGLSGTEDYHLDHYRIAPGNPAVPGETIISTGITGLGADPNPAISATLGGLPVQIVSLENVFLNRTSSEPDGRAVLNELVLPGVYTLTAVVPPGLQPGEHVATLTVGGITFDNIRWTVLIGDGGGGGGGEEGAPSISDGGIILASLFPR